MSFTDAQQKKIRNSLIRKGIEESWISIFEKNYKTMECHRRATANYQKKK